jgi:hemolysin activation/secretion protein
MQHRVFELGGGISDGLRDGWTQRYLAGLRYDARTFADRDESAAAPIPDDRTYVYPWIGVELLEDAYLKTRNLDQIGRTEDLYLGRSARLELGFASTAFGSTDDALMLGGTLRAGRDLGSEQYLINTLAFDGRLEGTVLRDAMIDLNTRYYRRQSPHRVLFAAVSGSLVSKLDEEEQLLLGGDNGLRGYPLRYQAGTARALLTVEERFYTSWQPLKLFNVGGALFVDAGRTWGRDPYAGSSLGWLKDVGFGLRLGSARSGLGNILRIDLAFPLDGGSDLDRVQLLIESRRSF